MQGKKLLGSVVMAGIMAASPVLPAHAGMFEDVVDFDKGVSDAGGLYSWTGNKVDEFVGNVKEKFIDATPFSDNIRDARDIYQLREGNESKLMDHVTKGIRDFNSVDPGTFSHEGKQLGLDYMKAHGRLNNSTTPKHGMTNRRAESSI